MDVFFFFSDSPAFVAALAGAGGALVASGLALWLLLRRRDRTPAREKPKRTTREMMRQRKDRRRRERDENEARVQVELEKYRRRLGVSSDAREAVEAVKQDPERAAHAVRAMMKH